MSGITKSEADVLLTLFKEFNENHNANTLAKKLKLTRVAVMYILRNIEKKGILIKKQFGKGFFYKVNLDDALAVTIIKTLLMMEAKEKAGRWLWEFRELYHLTKVVILFGSAIRNYKKANDLDVVMVFEKGNWDDVHNYVKEENKLLMKPIHPIKQMPSDLVRNLKKPDPVLLNALKGYVLHGYEMVIEAVNSAQKAHGLFAVPRPETRYDDSLLNV